MKTCYLSIRILLLVLLLSLFTPRVFAQTSTKKRDYISNNMIWQNIGLQGKIKNKFIYQFDFEYRRQADPGHAADSNASVGESHYNIVKNPYQFALRPWILYQPKDFIVFAVSPLCWFGTWASPVNGVKSFQPELRSSFQIMLISNIGRVIINHRYRYELRYFGVKTSDDTANPFGPSSSYEFPQSNRQGRARYMLRATVPINKPTIEKGTYYAMANAEILIRTGKNISNINLFDQYRISLNLGWKFSSDVRFEIGYISMTAFRFNNQDKNNVEANNIIISKLIFDNFNNLFTKKKTVKPYLPNDD
jgi:hypothetical protein